MSSTVEQSALFSPVTVGAFQLSHRIAYAPMTRNRGIPSTLNPGTSIACPLMAEYYVQRTTPGALMISEALPVSKEAFDGAGVPGILTDEQIEAWKPVVDAVHAAGGIFVAQLWHQGRNRKFEIDGRPILSSSATRIESLLRGGSGHVPKAMTLEDIELVKGQYVQAALNALKAGFDGVEIHGANGYLPDQFLHSNINVRTDKYGGSMENRNRFVVELSTAVAKAIGPNRFGLRLAPYGFFNECRGEKRVEQWSMLCEAIKGLGFAYIHFMEPRYDEIKSGSDKLAELGGGEVTLEPFRTTLGDVPVIVAGGYDAVNAPAVIEEGKADVIAFGRYFTSNPDLVYRLQHGKPLVRYIRPRFYGPFPEDPEVGYTDFPFCAENSTTPDRKAMLETKFAKGLEIAEPGWQLSSSGVQMGGGIIKTIPVKA